jgi:hypothetical protein
MTPANDRLNRDLRALNAYGVCDVTRFEDAYKLAASRCPSAFSQVVSVLSEWLYASASYRMTERIRAEQLAKHQSPKGKA